MRSLLWSEPQPGQLAGAQPGGQALFAARGIDAYPGMTIFSAPQELTASALGEQATVAIDPRQRRRAGGLARAGRRDRVLDRRAFQTTEKGSLQGADRGKGGL